MTRKEQDKTIVVGVGERVSLDCTMAPYINSTGPEQFWEIQWTAALTVDGSLKNTLYWEGNILRTLLCNTKVFQRVTTSHTIASTLKRNNCLNLMTCD